VSGEFFREVLNPPHASHPKLGVRVLTCSLLPHPASSVCGAVAAEEDEGKTKEKLACDTVVF